MILLRSIVTLSLISTSVYSFVWLKDNLVTLVCSELAFDDYTRARTSL